jgi:hypothetical protein
VDRIRVVAVIAVAVVLIAFIILVPVAQTSSLVGAKPGPCSSNAFCVYLVQVGSHHYDSLSMLILGFGAASSGIFGSGYYYSIYS